MAIIPSQAGQGTPRQGTPFHKASPALAPGRASVLALSAGFRLLGILPLLLALWLTVAWALAD